MDAHTAKIITCNVHSVVMSSCLFFFYYAKFRKKINDDNFCQQNRHL